MNKGLKIITLDATDLFQYDTKTKQVVSSNLTQFYQMKDENGELLKDEDDNVLQFYKRNLFRMKLENSMGLDELMRLITQKRMTKKAIFKVGFKEATNQVIHVTKLKVTQRSQSKICFMKMDLRLMVSNM